ncbi:MAG TPA: hypothetical protein VGR72_04005 [Candidatus Acidoferrales bacterium]|nr:hypothetical protein [Candidatus Acidoferrales bacterium]
MNCCSSGKNEKQIRPGPIGTVARILLSLLAFGGATLALRAGGPWIVFSLALAAFGTLLGLAAVMREPGCEVNLIWNRLLGNPPIRCILFSPIDRWEHKQNG